MLAISTITRALQVFGSKVVLVELILLHVAKMFEDPNDAVRKKVRQLMAEIYRWEGMEAISVRLSFLALETSQDLNSTSLTFLQCNIHRRRIMGNCLSLLDISEGTLNCSFWIVLTSC